MTTDVDFYSHKDRKFLRFIYRNLAAALDGAGAAEERLTHLTAFLQRILDRQFEDESLKLKWVMPAFLRDKLTPDERAEVEGRLAKLRAKRNYRLLDVFPTCADEFSIDTAFLGSVIDARKKPLITAETNTFTIGSCFARNIAAYLSRHGFKALNFKLAEDLNSPSSNAVMLAVAGLPAAKRAEYLRWWLGAFLGGSLPNAIEQEVQTEIAKLDHLAAAVSLANVLIVTLGNTVDYYIDPAKINPVAGPFTVAPKFLQFGTHENATRCGSLTKILRENGAELRLGTFAETKASLLALYEGLRKFNARAPIIFTVSPVPLESALGLKNAASAGAIELDCRSKSTLRSAIGEIIEEGLAGADTHYYPSFEIVRWIGPNLPIRTFGEEDAASRHVSGDILNGVFAFFLEKYGVTSNAGDDLKVEAID